LDENQLRTCKDCQRSFREEVYFKHAKICKKVFQSKRKAFDTKQQRIIDTDHAMMLKHKEIMEKKNKGKQVQEKPKSQKWKKQSEEFQRMIRENRNIAKQESMGNKYTPNKGGKSMGRGQIGGGGMKQQQPISSYTNIPSSLTDDYTLCDMCGRKYNENAYNKHLPTCERRTKEALMKNKLKSNTGSTGFGNKPNINTRFKK
jgi:hypothetical protein